MKVFDKDTKDVFLKYSEDRRLSLKWEENIFGERVSSNLDFLNYFIFHPSLTTSFLAIKFLVLMLNIAVRFFRNAHREYNLIQIRNYTLDLSMQQI